MAEKCTERGQQIMKIVLFMSSGFDAFSPSLHLYRALIEDLISAETPYDVVEEVNSGNTDVVEEESNSTAVVITFIFAAAVIVLVFMGYRLKNIKK